MQKGENTVLWKQMDIVNGTYVVEIYNGEYWRVLTCAVAHERASR